MLSRFLRNVRVQDTSGPFLIESHRGETFIYTENLRASERGGAPQSEISRLYLTCAFLSLGLQTSGREHWPEVPVLQDSCLHCPECPSNPPSPTPGRQEAPFQQQCVGELTGPGQRSQRAPGPVHAAPPPPRALCPGSLHLQMIDTPSPSPCRARPSHLSTRCQGGTRIILVPSGA